MRSLAAVANSEEFHLLRCAQNLLFVYRCLLRVLSDVDAASAAAVNISTTSTPAALTRLVHAAMQCTSALLPGQLQRCPCDACDPPLHDLAFRAVMAMVVHADVFCHTLNTGAVDLNSNPHLVRQWGEELQVSPHYVPGVALALSVTCCDVRIHSSPAGSSAGAAPTSCGSSRSDRGQVPPVAGLAAGMQTAGTAVSLSAAAF